MSDPTSIVILGSTGSIGRQALEVVAALPERLRVAGLVAGSNLELFAEQVRRWKPPLAALHDEAAARRLKELLGDSPTRVLGGAQGVAEVAATGEGRLVLNAMLGAAGLQPTLDAMAAGKDIALANKETLVAAGEIVTEAARRHNVALLPVDSEHSAMAQCLLGETAQSVARLTLTASGGPFVDTPRDQLAACDARRALQHPTWNMGRKITVDSATLMNKALESIEARWLFDVPMEQIDIVVHRQSIIHSFVTFADNSVKAQLGVPDMRLPIQWALLYPERSDGIAPPLDLTTMGPLTFEAPDRARFPALELATRAMQMGGSAPAAMNAANEIAVHAFLEGRTSFYGITDCIAAVLERCAPVARPALGDIFEADRAARAAATAWLCRSPSS